MLAADPEEVDFLHQVSGGPLWDAPVLGVDGAWLLPWFVAAVGVLGLIIGSFLNVVVWRVPRGESLIPGSRCPKCRALIRPWQNVPVLSWLALRGRCARCRERISVRYPLVELVTGAAFAGVTWWMVGAFGWPREGALAVTGWWLILVAYLWFAAAGIALALIDIEHRRLPDAIVLPSFGVVALALAAAALLGGAGPALDWTRLVWTGGGALALLILYLVIILVAPNGMGGGDLKLAPLTGAALGFIGWGALAVGAFAAFLLGALYGLGLVIAGRAGRKSAVPFGPFMLLGAWIGILWGEQIMHAYLVLTGIAR